MYVCNMGIGGGGGGGLQTIFFGPLDVSLV